MTVPLMTLARSGLFGRKRGGEVSVRRLASLLRSRDRDLERDRDRDLDCDRDLGRALSVRRRPNVSGRLRSLVWG